MRRVRRTIRAGGQGGPLPVTLHTHAFRDRCLFEAGTGTRCRISGRSLRPRDRLPTCWPAIQRTPARRAAMTRRTDGESVSGAGFPVLGRGRNPWRREREFSPFEVLHVAGHPVLHAAGHRQFQRVVICQFRRVGPMSGIGRLADGRRAEVVRQAHAFRRRHHDVFPKAFPMDQRLLVREPRGARDGRVCPGETAVQHLRACTLCAERGGDEHGGLLREVHKSRPMVSVMSVKRVIPRSARHDGSGATGIGLAKPPCGGCRGCVVVCLLP